MKKNLLFFLPFVFLISLGIYYSSYPLLKEESKEEIIRSIEEFHNNDEEPEVTIHHIINDLSFGSSNRIILYETNNETTGYAYLDRNLFGRYKINYVTLGTSEFSYEHLETSEGPFFLFYGENKNNVEAVNLPISYNIEDENTTYKLEKMITLSKGKYFSSVSTLPEKVKDSFMDSNDFHNSNLAFFE
ncbi:hypothetical protein ACFFJY_02810 [Fictibacillus aquaticus]|uniref:Uncharacterized protein n=1 Tax=Fictibacillus aquaticus TaxID=2021314 RepID=A0A235F8F6_9BACL|nr:hypothetical protein [Fictibacillus aquaticus]OYD57631.1 hypothetical protein CGZ90_13275 [Fictibacillus aquaticus]